MPPVDDLEVRVDHVDLGARCTTPPCVGHAFLKLRAGTHPAKVRLLGVTIAGHGRSYTIGSSVPSIWASEDTYEPWNETIGADDAMWIRYDLERVDWDHFGGDEVRVISVLVEVDGRARVFSLPERGDPVDDFAVN